MSARVSASAVLLGCVLLPLGLAATVSDGSETRRDVVDVLVGFDRGAVGRLRERSVDLQEFAGVQIDLANEALVRSGLGDEFRFRLVGIEAFAVTVTNYQPSGTATTREQRMYWMHRQFQAVWTAPEDVDEPGWFDLFDARERVAADVLMVIADCGGGDGMTGLSNGLEVMDPRYPWNSPLLLDRYAVEAMGICHLDAVLDGYTFQHELGHMMGAGHASADQVNRETIPVGPQLFPDSCAYLFRSEGTLYSTLMGYTRDGYGNSCERVLSFSSPNVTFLDADGVDTGIPLGVLGKYDNVRALREAYPYVAQFRTHVVRHEDERRIQTVAVGGGSVKSVYCGFYRQGSELPLSAEADKGKVFAGWFETDGEVTNRLNGSVDWRIAENRYVVGESDVTLIARFEDKNRSSDPIKGIFCQPPAECQIGEETAVAVTVCSASLPTVFVNDLPKGLRYDEATGTIRGIPEKPGTYSVSVTARNASGSTSLSRFTFIVGNIRSEMIPVADVYGPLVPGLAVTVELTGAAGCAVRGIPAGMVWKKTAGILSGTPTKPGRYTLTLTRGTGKSSSSVTTTILVGDYPVLPLSVISNGRALLPDETAVLRVGVQPDLLFSCLDEDLKDVSPLKFSAKGLPSGLRCEAKSGVVSGSATKAGSAHVIVSAANGIKWSGSTCFNVDVLKLPEWATGTFCGPAVCNGITGTVTMTMRETGKASGKFVAAGSRYSFSASGFSEENREDDHAVFAFDQILRKNGKSDERRLVFRPVQYAQCQLSGFAAATDADSEVLRRNLWKDKEYKLPKVICHHYELAGRPGAELSGDDSLQIKLGSRGTVIFAGRIGGRRVSGSTTLSLISAQNEEMEAVIDLVVPAKMTSGFLGWAKTIRLVAPKVLSANADFEIKSVIPLSFSHIY